MSQFSIALMKLTSQTFNDFEVIIVEDGSQKPCKEVCDKYTDKLNLKYFMKENSGPGQSRNYGAERSEGEYLLILDSDVVLPENYLYAIEEELHRDKADAFGGPDRAHNSFTDTQKAISYSMTSFFTTGGIRGGKKKMDKFYPRSFNMGIRREVYNKLGGKFWRQVYNSGIARINLYKKYPESLKLVHLLPMVFTVGVGICCILAMTGVIIKAPLLTALGLLPLLLYSLLIFTDSSIQNKSIKIGILSIRAAFTQLTGYGCGFIEAWWKRCVQGKDEFSAYQKNFYK